MTELDHLSHSQVSTYISCGEKYRLRYVERRTPTPQGAFLGGIAVHETIEEAANTGLWSEPEAFEEGGTLHLYFMEKFTELITEAGGSDVVRWGGRKSKTFPNGEDLDWWLQFGPGMLRRYHEVKLADVEEGWEVMGAEIEASFYLDSGTRVVARMDEVLSKSDGAIKVRDYKTGQSRPEERIQLGLYAQACKVTLGIMPTMGELCYLKKAGTAVVDFDAGGWVPTVMRWMELAEDGLRKDVFVAHPSSFCMSCNVQEGCFYWQQMSRDAEIVPEGSNDG